MPERGELITLVASPAVMKGSDMHSVAWYSSLAKSAARFCGRPRTFALAAGVIVAWLVSGPLFGFSDTWQLVINTGTTIVTFIMVS